VRLKFVRRYGKLTVRCRIRSFLTFDNLAHILSSITKPDEFRLIWLASLKECESRVDRIIFSDFKTLVKGRPKDAVSMTSQSQEVGKQGLQRVY
jgi:hypothetical protein